MKKTDSKANIPAHIALRLENSKYFGNDMWLPLPVTQEQFNLAGFDVCDCWDDLKIGWCSSTIPGLYVTKMKEVSISVLNHLAERLNSLTEEQLLILSGLMESLNGLDSVKEIIEFTYNTGLFSFTPGIYTYKQLGQLRVSALNFKGLPRGIKECIDIEIFGIQTTINEMGRFTPLGYVSAKQKARHKLLADRNRRVPADLELKGINGEDLFITDNFDSCEFSELPEPEME